MATSDTIYTGYRNYSRFYLSWSVGQQDTANNRSLINWTAGVQGQPGYTAYWYSNAIRLNSVYVDGQGNLASGTWSNITLSNGQSVPLRSGSVWIYHSGDGTKSFSASVSGWFYGNGDISTSGSWSIPTIPRNSQVSTDASTYTLGDPITVNTNRVSTSFSHTITIRKDNSSGTLLKTFNSVADSVTWTPTSGEITTLQGLIPTSNTLTLYINSYNDQVGQSSNTTVTLNITNANPTFSNFTYRDSNSTVTTITGNNQILVKGQSTLETTISSANKMVALKNSTADHYTIVYDGTTLQEPYQSSTSIVDTFSPITTIGQRTILVTAFDSRNNNTSVAKQVTVYDYSAPTIESTLTRENNYGSNTTIHLEGDWSPLTIGGVDKNALTVGSLQYRYKEDGGSFGSWTAKTFTAGSGTWTISSNFIVSLDSTKKYVFEFKITDKFGTVTTTATVDVGNPILFIGENSGTASISIGSMPVAGAKLTIGGVNFLDLVYPVGSIYISVTSTSPSTFFGGTWVSWGSGRVPTGVDAFQTEFNTVEKTGGEKTHTLTTTEMPSHTHTQDPHKHVLHHPNQMSADQGYPAGGFTAVYSSDRNNATGSAAIDNTTATNQNTGGGAAHNTLPPYITCFMWKRTA